MYAGRGALALHHLNRSTLDEYTRNSTKNKELKEIQGNDVGAICFCNFPHYTQIQTCDGGLKDFFDATAIGLNYK